MIDRQLSDKELDLIRQVKAYESVFLALVGEVGQHIEDGRQQAKSQNNEIAMHRMNRAEPERWLAIGETHVQQAVMAMIRAIEQPEPFYRSPPDERVSHLPEPDKIRPT